LLRSLQEIQPDFEEETKASAGLCSQGKKKKKKREQLHEYALKDQTEPLCITTRGFNKQ
jgi:hypothetical protein